MRINDKNLCAFATSATPVDREGWLCKRGEVHKTYQKRWFVLKGNLLFYFEKKGDKEPIGVIILEGCTIELSEEDESYSFKIVFHGESGRSYLLFAESQISMEEWMKALGCASYDYMKLMVTDLQRQIDEIEAATAREKDELAGGGGPASGACSLEPRAPPRRHNPFNKTPEPTHRVVPGSRHNREAVRNPEMLPKPVISFRELHNMYGKRILADRNEWRRNKRLRESGNPEQESQEQDSLQERGSLQNRQSQPDDVVLIQL